MKKLLIALLFISFILIAQSNKQISNEIPHIVKQGSALQLYVKGKPLLMLAGETGNSSASDLNYMANIWPAVSKMNLNPWLFRFIGNYLSHRKTNLILPTLIA